VVVQILNGCPHFVLSPAVDGNSNKINFNFVFYFGDFSLFIEAILSKKKGFSH